MVRKNGRADNLRGRADIGLRQIKSESAALARCTSQLDFSTEEAGQFAADCETKACAAVLTAGAGVCLLESFEDDALGMDWLDVFDGEGLKAEALGFELGGFGPFGGFAN